jgi:ribose/xylose/arabinose/galactoside ABC-type transport system permease subunit/ABC-type multidrug transport system ATPase subunit
MFDIGRSARNGLARPLLARLRPEQRVGGDTTRTGLALVAVALALLFEVVSGDFLTGDNVDSILLNSSSLLIVGIAAGALLISGNVDLSIGGMLAVVSVVTGLVARDTDSTLLAVAFGVGLGAVLGLLNGVLVRSLSISPLIVTLGTATVFRGLAYVFANGGSVFDFPEGFTELGRSSVAGVPIQVVISLVFFGLCALLITRSVFGIRTYAIGGNREAARVNGVPVDRHVTSLYAFSGFAVGVVAVLTTAQLGSGTPTVGLQFEFDVLTAVILGGIGFAGGTGRPMGIFVGVITIGILDAGMIFVGVADFWQQVAKGAVLLLALASDQIAAARRARRMGRGDTTRDLAGASRELVSEERARHGPPPRSGADLVLRVSGLSKRYGGVWAVQDVSFDVHRGEVVCLVGDNGAGKSSVIKCISGAMSADAGSMQLNGRPYAPTTPAAARSAGVATVYQDLALCPNLGAALNLVLGDEPRRGRLGGLSRLDFARAEHLAAERLGSLGIALNDYFRPMSSLSGGQRQSVAIARVVVPEVSLVILDEPTAALGVAQSARVLALCRRLADQGIGVIMITHDVETVTSIADRVVVLRLGRTLYDGPAESLNPSSLLHLMAGMAAAPEGAVLTPKVTQSAGR